MIFLLYKMLFYLILCNILFIPIILCNNTSVSKTEITNKTLSHTQKEKQPNATKMQLLSEGGSILPETLNMALPEDNHTKTNQVTKNKVVPRKGVLYPGNITKSEETSVPSNDKVTIPASTVGNVIGSNNKVNHTAVVNKTTVLDNTSKLPKVINKTETIKKPLILNSDILENQTVKSSPETLTSILPNRDVKSYVASATNHPGMVMPIVITILLVPMFAVLGYMALRRGQEAWKNRHYKRMDFLLDGMYND